MDRRKFLSWLGVGVVGAAVAPSALFSEGPACVTPFHTIGSSPEMFKTYADYSNFSEFAISSSIDDIVANAAKELGEAAGRDIAALHSQVFA